MGVELVPTPKGPKNRSLAIRLIAKFYPLRMLLSGRSARVLKTLAMESSLDRLLDCGFIVVLTLFRIDTWAMMHRFFGKGRQKLQNFLPISCLVIKSAWLLVTLSRSDQRTTICP